MSWFARSRTGARAKVVQGVSQPSQQRFLLPPHPPTRESGVKGGCTSQQLSFLLNLNQIPLPDSIAPNTQCVLQTITQGTPACLPQQTSPSLHILPLLANTARPCISLCEGLETDIVSLIAESCLMCTLSQICALCGEGPQNWRLFNSYHHPGGLCR
jgi:hypothetical protein